MRSLLVILILLSNILCGYSQSAENRYNSRMTRDGVLFFIMPQPIKDLSGLKKFEYDVTMLSWTDTATVNFTIETTSLKVPTDLKIEYEGGSVKCNSFSPLYVDIKKDHYEIRITSKFSNIDIEAIFASPTSPIFSFDQGDEPKTAAYKPKAWVKDRKKLNDIVQLFLFSR